MGQTNILGAMECIENILSCGHRIYIDGIIGHNNNIMYVESLIRCLNIMIPNEKNAFQKLCAKAKEIKDKESCDVHDLIVDKRFLKRCGNWNCRVLYTKHKFGMNVEDAIKGSKTQDILNKWFICKGCRRTFYCSRKCQKIAWNMQYHKHFCNNLFN